MASTPPTLRARLSDAVRTWAASVVAKDDGGSGIWGGAFSTFMGMSPSAGGVTEIKDNPVDYARSRTSESYVFTCEQVRGRSISQVPLRTWQTDAQGKRQAIEHEALGILETTNPYGFVDGVPALMRYTLTSLDLFGRNAWQLAFDRRGKPSEIYWQNPTQWAPLRDPKKFFGGIRLRTDDTVKEIPAEQLVYLTSDNPLDPLLGTSRIAVLKNPVNLRAYSQWNNIDFFKNSMRPDWMLSGSFANTEDNIERLRRGIRRMLSGANNRAPLILGEGMTAHLLTTSHEDAQWVEQQRLAQEEISAVFGVPLIYLNNLERATYENIKTAKLVLWHDTMIPDADDLADRLNRRFLWRFWPETKDRRITFGFDYDEIEGLGEDLALIWERVVKMSHQISEQVKERELTPNQARMLRDQLFGDLGIDTAAFQGDVMGGDEFYENFAFVPVDQLSIQAVMDVWAMRGQNPEFVESVPGAENADANADDVLDRLNKPQPMAPGAVPPNGKPPGGPQGAPSGGRQSPPPSPAPPAPKSAEQLKAELKEQEQTARRLKRYFQDQQTAALRAIRSGSEELYDRGAFKDRLREIVGPYLAREIERETQALLKRGRGEDSVRSVFRHAIDAWADAYAERKLKENPERPLHDQFLSAERHYARRVAHALRGALDAKKVARGWTRWAEQVTLDAGRGRSRWAPKADDQQPSDALRFQARSYAASLGISLSELMDVLRATYGDSWQLGQGGAYEALKRGRFETLVGSAGVDWSTWEPGNELAAEQLADGGLQNLLNEADIRIKSIQDTALDDLADVLAKGAARGDSVDTIAAAIEDLLDDPSRAEMIARTELARGVGAATLATYRENGIEGKGWLTYEPCPKCAENEDVVVPVDSIFPSGDLMPPAHPRCVCTLTPEIMSRVEADTLAAPHVITRKEALYTLDRPAGHDHSTEPGEPPVLVLDLHGTITPSNGFTEPGAPGLMLPPFDGWKEFMDELAAGGVCLHICTAAMSPYHPPELLEARKMLVKGYCTAYGLPISFTTGKVGAHVYCDDRLVRFTGDVGAFRQRVLKKLDKRFEKDPAGIWRRRDIPETGSPIEEFPDPATILPDRPRGLSTPICDIDLHRCLFNESSSKLTGSGLRPGALEAVTAIYQAGYQVHLSCAGFDPQTHPAKESAQRLASLRKQTRERGVPYDDMVSKDHPDVAGDDKGYEFIDWRTALPDLLQLLSTPHPEDEVTRQTRTPE